MMTFDKWTQTIRRQDKDFAELLENTFGYVPENVLSVLVYDPGVIAYLENGQYFTHIGRSEHIGALAHVERKLWDDYAKGEVG